MYVVTWCYMYITNKHDQTCLTVTAKAINQHPQLKSYPKVRLLDVFTKIVELNIAECNEHQWTPNVCSARTSGWTDMRRLCRSAFVKESQNITEYHGHGISPNRSHSQSWNHTSLVIFSSCLCDREDPVNLPYLDYLEEILERLRVMRWSMKKGIPHLWDSLSAVSRRIFSGLRKQTLCNQSLGSQNEWKPLNTQKQSKTWSHSLLKLVMIYWVGLGQGKSSYRNKEKTQNGPQRFPHIYN